MVVGVARAAAVTLEDVRLLGMDWGWTGNMHGHCAGVSAGLLSQRSLLVTLAPALKLL